MRGIRVVPESKERDRLAFAFMSNGISSERQVETAVRQTAALMQPEPSSRGRRSSWWPDPWSSTPAARRPLAKLIRGGWVHALLSGNALGVHDIEAALLGTSLGVRLTDGRQEEHGHRNHMRAINAIYHAGGIAKAVESGTPDERHHVRMREGTTCPSCWPAACATTVRCPTPSPT